MPPSQQLGWEECDAAVLDAVAPVQPAALLVPGLPTAAHGAGARFSIACAVRIAAKPAECVAALADSSTWPDWNRFSPRVRDVQHADPAPPPPPGLGRLAEAAGGALRVGTRFGIEVHMNLDPNRISHVTALEVSALDEIAQPATGDRPARRGFRVAWRTTGLIAYMLHAERTQELTEAEGGGTDYLCWESFYGPLADVVKWTHGGALQAGFDAWMYDLKAYVEKQVAEGQS